MIIDNVEVDFPVLTFRMNVTFSSPRPATIFERMILDLAHRFGQHATYGAMPLGMIFENFLAVDDPDGIVSPILLDLRDLGVISIPSPAESIFDVAAKDLTVTDPLGLQMLRDGMLPARAQGQITTLCIDPIRAVIVSPAESAKATEQPGSAAIDVTVFEDAFPVELIQAQLQEDRPPWLPRGARIDAVRQSGEPVVSWLTARGRIEVAAGRVTLRFDDESRSRYVANLPASEVVARVLQPTFAGRGISASDIAALPPAADSDFQGERWQPLESCTRSFFRNKNILLPAAWSHLSSGSPPSGHCRIIFDDTLDAGSRSIEWNDSRNGCTVKLPHRYPFLGSVAAAADGILGAGLLPVRVGDEASSLPVARVNDSREALESVNGVLRDTGRLLLAGGVPDDILAAAILLSPKDFWSTASSSEPAATVEDAIVAIQRLLDKRRLFRELPGNKDVPNWGAVAAQSVIRSIDTLCERLTPERFAPLAVWLAQLGISDTRDVTPIMAAIAARATPPGDLPSFQAYAELFRPCGPQWAMPYPSEYYSPGVLAAVAAWRDEHDLRAAFSSHNRFDSIVRELVDSESKLRAVTGLADLAAVSIAQNPAAAIGRAKSAEVSALVSVWLNRFQALIEACPSLEAVLPNSRLAASDRQMSALARHLESSDAHVDKRFCHPWGIFVFDTSALIRDPSLPSRLGRDQLVIVTKRVLEELDDLKRDESLRSAVTKASRALQDHPRDRIRFVDANPDLLPLDYRSGGTHRLKGDNLILSVAMKYGAYEPILVTNDNNLSLKAHAQNIRALTAAEFHDHAASGWRSSPSEVASSPPVARNPR